MADFDVGVFYDDNLSRAQAPGDRRGDRALSLRASLGRRFVVTGCDAATLSAQLAADKHDRYPGLDFVSAGVTVAFRRKLGLGLTAPYVAGSLGASYAAHREDTRDGATFVATLDVGRRFDESLAVAVGASYDRRDGRHDRPLVPGISGAIFDLAGYAVRAQLEHSLDERWLLAGRISLRRGDVESTSQRSPAVFLASDAIAADPAFRDAALIGYRLYGTTAAATLGVSYALGDRSSLNAGVAIERTRAAQDIEYRGRSVNATFAYRFAP